VGSSKCGVRGGSGVTQKQLLVQLFVVLVNIFLIFDRFMLRQFVSVCACVCVCESKWRHWKSQ